MVKDYIRRDEALKRGRERRGENDDIGACSTFGESTRVVEGHVRQTRRWGYLNVGSSLSRSTAPSAVHTNMYPFLT